MRKNKKDYFDYTILYAITNTTVAVILYGLSIYFFVIYIRNLLLRIILCIIVLPICLQFEYKYLIRIVNPVVDFFIPKSWKRAEEEWIDSCRQQAKTDRIAKSRAETEANRIAKSAKRKANGK